LLKLHLMKQRQSGLTLMAAIERGEGASDDVVRGWLTKALTASRGPQWVCSTCQQVHAVWAPVCDSCSSFDTLAWTTPTNSDVAMPSGTEMLPLIVGQLGKDEAVEDAPAHDDVIDVEVADAEEVKPVDAK